MITRRRFTAQAAASAVAPGFIARAARAQPLSAQTWPAQTLPAQNWPSRFVRIVVPYASGGPTDAVVRTVADPLARAWGQQVVIENKGGAGTNIGAEAVARSDPDGYTLLVGSSALSMNRNLYRSLSYDAIADFAPVSLICSFSFFMCVPNSSPAKSVQEFIAYAKEKGGKLTFATPGPGTPPHMAGELFKRMAGIEMLHVPYRGAGLAYNDLIAGRIDLQFASGVALELIRSGQVRGLAISSAKRNAAASALPTVAEAGVLGFEVSSWFAFFLPARTPPDIVKKINADTVAALADPAVKTRLELLGYTVIGSTADELAIHLQSDIDKWGPVIKDAGIRIDG
jgi:tripartite-type tricarboxylate transporter receptor subunit TctC